LELVVRRHGELYSEEYDWNEKFAALVREIGTDFIAARSPHRCRAWIAECGKRFAGSVFLVDRSRSVAQLRLLLVEPFARRRGLGTRLIRLCIDFAKSCGYSRLTLWTNEVLQAARCLYDKEGVRLVSQKSHHSYGQDLVGEEWELQLDP
jgi:GNAT superfamily N-acetyltransferase